MQISQTHWEPWPADIKYFLKCFRALRKYSNKAYEMGKDKMIEERLKILKIDSFHK